MPLIATISIVIIIMILNLLSAALKSQKNKNREKNSNFECGFDPLHSMRVAFSLRFFLMTVVFLIFDLEIIAMMPLPLMSTNTLNTNIYNSHSFLFFMLHVGLAYEWSQKNLNWK